MMYLYVTEGVTSRHKVRSHYIHEYRYAHIPPYIHTYIHIYIYSCTHSISITLRKLVTTSSDKTAHIYDVRNDFKLLCELKGHQAWVWDCAFSADSQFIVTGMYTSTRLCFPVCDGIGGGTTEYLISPS